MEPIALMLHGGAGTPARDDPGEPEARAALQQILDRGQTLLLDGAHALDTVTEVVALLEDCPLFNAGRGAVLNARGEVELDAAVMDGPSQRLGALTLLRRCRNPVRAARRLLELENAPVLLGASAADAWAASQGLAMVEPEHFHTPKRLAQWQAWRAQGGVPAWLDHCAAPATGMGTVGAVARDRQGRLAAATSTGGMTGKWPGRIGDCPVAGAGTLASPWLAVSCTGTGEAIIRARLASQVEARLRWAGQDLRSAVLASINEELAAVGGQGGLIALSQRGPAVMALNTPGMYRASCLGSAAGRIAIWAEEG